MAAAAATPHVLRVIQDMEHRISGPSNQAREVATRVARSGDWRSSIVTCQLPGIRHSDADLRDGVAVHRYPARGPFLSSFISPLLLRHVARAEYDILHVHGFRNLVSDASMVIGRRRKRPVVLQPHGMALGYRFILQGVATIPYRLYDAVARPLVPLKADAVIAATKQEREECIEYGLPAERVVVIPVGIDEARFVDPRPVNHTSDITMLFVGRVSRDRNVAALLHATAFLLRRGHRVRLRIVGPAVGRTSLERPGYVGELHRLMDELSIHPYVSFVGERRGGELLHEFAAADIFGYPSPYENFGQALLEAAAAGLPLISTPVGVALDLIKPGVTGYLLRPDASDLGNVLEHALRAPALLPSIGRAAQAVARREYAWPNVVAQYAQVYRDLLGSRARY